MTIFSPIRIGIASRTVNPAKPAVPVGHWGTTRYQQVHADLRVQAAVIADGDGHRIVLAEWDTCVVHGDMADRVKAAIGQRHPIDAEAICINASHTHSAPPLSTDMIPSVEYFDPEYAENFERQAVGVIEDALANLQPAQLRYAESSCTSIGINRRMMIENEVLMRPNPNGPVDHRVQVLAAQSPDCDKLIAVIVKYACHPVTVGLKGLGSDYPGFMREFIEVRHPGVTAMFLQGCSGDIRIRNVNEQGDAFIDRNVLGRAKQFGEDLGMSVEAALSKKGAVISGPIQYRYKEIMLPVNILPDSEYRKTLNMEKQNTWARKFCSMLDQGQPLPTQSPYHIQLFQLKRDNGKPFYIFGLEGEVFTDYAIKTTELLHDPQAMVLGLCNDYHGYVPTQEALSQGGYEVAHAYRLMPYLPGPYQADMESIFLREVAALAKQ